MSWLSSPEFKVGFLVVAVSTLIGGMALKVAEGPSFFGGKQTYFFHSPNAGGLVQNSAVKMAGIKIGIIDKIILEDGRARIVVALDGDSKLTTSTRVALKSDGILGDKHVELSPGNTSDPLLPLGSEIPLAAGQGGMDDIMATVDKVAKQMSELLDTLNKATKEGDDSSTVGRIVLNIEQLTDDLKEITGENKEKVSDILDRIRNISKNIDSYINEESLSRIDHSLKNIDEITSKINKGEGTLGRLINDEQTVEEINTAVHNFNQFLGGAQKLETSVDFRSEFMNSGQNKSFLGIRLQPGLDRYYDVQVVSDTQGVVRTESTQAVRDGTPSSSTQTTTYKGNYKFTLLFAKNFWDFTLKGGLIESAGGFGIDYYMLNRHLRFSTEFFNFQEAQLRAFARYTVFRGLYVSAGGDNLMGNYGRPATVFFGAGLFITNDDLKTLAARISFR